MVPVINQIELHPYFSQEKQRDYNKKLGIVTESWSPLGRASNVLQDPVLKEIAHQHKKSVGQVILRWHIQIGAVPIPKAFSDERQKENIDIFSFKLSDANMGRINALTKENGRLQGQDPSRYEEF